MGKFVNFAKGLLTNRLGIVLATLNLCYFASRKYFSLTFEHTHGENCVFFNSHHFFDIFVGLGTNSSELLLILNLPAVFFSLLAGKFMQMVFPDFCAFTHGRFQIVFFLFFVTLQWLFIGWSAKIIASKMQSAKY